MHVVSFPCLAESGCHWLCHNDVVATQLSAGIPVAAEPSHERNQSSDRNLDFSSVPVDGNRYSMRPRPVG